MENIILIWFLRSLTIAALLLGIYVLAETLIKNQKKKLVTAKHRQGKIRESIIRVNNTLLDMGMSTDSILEFWKECLVEAEIQHKLPPCNCQDVNECETWCRAKARFKMNYWIKISGVK